jgi:predicted PurR-regulated permease PerM
MSNPRETTPVRSWPSRSQVRTLALAAATILVFYLCFRVAQPFLIPLVWAATLAVVTHPVHRWLAARIPNPNAAAAVSVALVTVLILGPAAWVATVLVREGRKGAVALQEAWQSGRGRSIVERVPGLSTALPDLLGGSASPSSPPSPFAPDRKQEEPKPAPSASLAEPGRDGGAVTEVEAAAAKEGIGPAVKARMPAILSETFKSGLEVLIALFALFFFFRDGERAGGALRDWLPMSRAESDHVLGRLVDTVKATTFGTVTVGTIQGVLGGLMFWWLGLPAPVLWGAVMALLAIVPVLGAFVVWMPAAVFLALEGSLGKALVLTAWGSIVIALADNLLYPVLVGRRLQMHTLPVFIAIIGGLSLFGAAGLVLGPAVLCLAIELLAVWKKRLRPGAVPPAKPIA